jgi:site-specific DNA recombinase
VPKIAEVLQIPEERTEAATAIRSLIERITLTPGAKRGQVEVTIEGELGTILAWAAQKQTLPPPERRECLFQWLQGVADRVIERAIWPAWKM